MVGYHELRKVTDNLGAWSDLDDVSTQLIGNFISLFDRSPLARET
jgi:hypothetical protein